MRMRTARRIDPGRLFTAVGLNHIPNPKHLNIPLAIITNKQMFIKCILLMENQQVRRI